MGGVSRDRERGCGRAREWVSLRLDGELSEFERLLLRRHLGRCDECAALAKDLEATTRLLRGQPQWRPSRSLVPGTSPVRVAPERRRRMVAVLALVVVSAAIGAAIGGLVGRGSDGGDGRPITTIVELPPPTTEQPTTGNV